MTEKPRKKPTTKKVREEVQSQGTTPKEEIVDENATTSETKIQSKKKSRKASVKTNNKTSLGDTPVEAVQTEPKKSRKTSVKKGKTFKEIKSVESKAVDSKSEETESKRIENPNTLQSIEPNELPAEVVKEETANTHPSTETINELVVELPDVLRESTEHQTQAPSEIQSENEVMARVDNIPVSVQVDQPTSRFGKYYKSKITRYGQPIDLRKFLLPNEEHLNGKMVNYFDEGQIFLGLGVLVFAIISYFWLSITALSIFLGLAGLALMTTGYASEELHITNYRIIMRRMDWVDRLFRIPKDSQYILDQIVAFDVKRAPPNRALLYSGVLPIILFIFPSVRASIFAIIVILTLSILLIILSQRLGRRTLSFLMSGGHQVDIGQYKGVPEEIVDSFTSIIMEKNIFESDVY